MNFVNHHTGEVKNVANDELKRTRRIGIAKRVMDETKRTALNCLLTLTLDKSKLPHDVCPFCFIRVVWDRFLKRLQRFSTTAISFITLIDVGKNGNVHLHVITNANLRLSWIRTAWCECGGGHIIDTQIIALHNELTACVFYLMKAFINSTISGRLISCSRDINLKPRPGNEAGEWEVLSEGEIGDHTAKLSWHADEIPYCVHGYPIQALVNFIARALPDAEEIPDVPPMNYNGKSGLPRLP
jgi:hypothetical protein